MAGSSTPPRRARSDPEEGPERVVRPPRTRPVNYRRRRAVVGVLSAIVILAAAVAGYGWWTYGRVDRVDLDLAEISDNQPRNYLIIGSDSRAEINEADPNSGAILGADAPGGQRSDSIAILRIDPASDRIDMLSIPRDLWVMLPDGEGHRINAAYAESTQTLVDAIDDNLGIPIHHFAEVDFTGFQQLIDALGGVPMYFDSPVRDANSGLRIPEAGCMVLDGPQGLAFARSRHLEWKDEGGWHTDPSGDLGRMTRQQLLMRAALGKARSLGLNDVGRLKGLIDAGLDSTTVDSGLGFGDILALGQRFSDFDPQRLQTHALAVDQDRTSGGASIVVLDEAAAADELALFRGSSAPSDVTTTTTPPPEPGDVTVTVLNGGGVDGEARRVSYVLSDGGFGVGEVESAPEPIVTSTVAHAPGGEAMAELVAAWIGPAPEIVEDSELEPGQVVVTLGSEFRTVDRPVEDEGGTDGATDGGEAGDVGVAEGQSAAGPRSDSTTTTSTTVPGWTPGTAPAGVDCS